MSSRILRVRGKLSPCRSLIFVFEIKIRKESHDYTTSTLSKFYCILLICQIEWTSPKHRAPILLVSYTLNGEIYWKFFYYLDFITFAKYLMDIKLRFTSGLKILSKWNKHFLSQAFTDLKAFAGGLASAFGIVLQIKCAQPFLPIIDSYFTDSQSLQANLTYFY